MQRGLKKCVIFPCDNEVLAKNKEANEAILKLIANHRALVKTAESKDFLDFYLPQIVDPTVNRPSRIGYYKHIKPGTTIIKLDLKTRKSKKYVVGSGRKNKLKNDSKHQYQHTLKTPLTLLPVEPKYLNLFLRSETKTGFLWDLNACDLKNERYIFYKDAITDHNYWLNYDGRNFIHPEYQYSITLDELKKQNDRAVSNKQPIKWNEILAGIPRSRMDAVFSPLNTVKSKLLALNNMYHAKKHFGYKLDIPVLIIQQGKDHRIYDHEERIKDILGILTSDNNKLINFLVKDNNSLLSNIVSSSLPYVKSNISLVKKIKDACFKVGLELVFEQETLVDEKKNVQKNIIQEDVKIKQNKNIMLEIKKEELLIINSFKSLFSYKTRSEIEHAFQAINEYSVEDLYQVLGVTNAEYFLKCGDFFRKDESDVSRDDFYNLINYIKEAMPYIIINNDFLENINNIEEAKFYLAKISDEILSNLIKIKNNEIAEEMKNLTYGYHNNGPIYDKNKIKQDSHEEIKKIIVQNLNSYLIDVHPMYRSTLNKILELVSKKNVDFSEMDKKSMISPTVLWGLASCFKSYELIPKEIQCIVSDTELSSYFYIEDLLGKSKNATPETREKFTALEKLLDAVRANRVGNISTDDLKQYSDFKFHQRFHKIFTASVNKIISEYKKGNIEFYNKFSKLGMPFSSIEAINNEREIVNIFLEMVSKNKEMPLNKIIDNLKGQYQLTNSLEGLLNKVIHDHGLTNTDKLHYSLSKTFINTLQEKEELLIKILNEREILIKKIESPATKKDDIIKYNIRASILSNTIKYLTGELDKSQFNEIRKSKDIASAFDLGMPFFSSNINGLIKQVIVFMSKHVEDSSLEMAKNITLNK